MNICSRVEKILWAVALASIGLTLFFALRGLEYRRLSATVSASPQVVAEFNLMNAPLQTSTAHRPSDVRTGTAVSQKILGRLEIPALRLSVAVLPDDDSSSLEKGVGHIRGTALPGGLGTVGIAGHRDTFFRPLRKIVPKMHIRLIDKTGAYDYIVDSTEIVTPDKVNVLNSVSRPELTLITCFPFNYLGAAPNRFIVHAHLLSVAPAYQ